MDQDLKAGAAPIMVEAVAEVCNGEDGLYLSWLIEGGICALVEGCVLVMPTKPITDNEGSGEVYTTAPQPAREPLTDAAIMDAYCKAPDIRQYVTAFKAGARFAEQHHGITAKP